MLKSLNISGLDAVDKILVLLIVPLSYLAGTMKFGSFKMAYRIHTNPNLMLKTDNDIPSFLCKTAISVTGS